MIRFPFNNKHGVVDYMTMATWGEIRDLDDDAAEQFMQNNIHDFRDSLVNVGESSTSGFYIPAIIGIKDSYEPNSPRVELQNKMLSEVLINKGSRQTPEFVSASGLYGSYVGDDATPLPWSSSSSIDAFISLPSSNFDISSSAFDLPPKDQSCVFNFRYVDEDTLDQQIEVLKNLNELTILKESHISILNAILYMNSLSNARGVNNYKRHICFYLNTVYGSRREIGTLSSFSIGGNEMSVFEKEEYTTIIGLRPSMHDYIAMLFEERKDIG